MASTPDTSDPEFNLPDSAPKSPWDISKINTMHRKVTWMIQKSTLCAEKSPGHLKSQYPAQESHLDNSKVKMRLRRGGRLCCLGEGELS